MAGHKFDPNNRHHLKSEKRRRLFPAEEILQSFGLQPGDVFLDVGCGTGYYTFPAARLTGSRGKVYAADISDVMLEELKQALTQEQLENVTPLLSQESEVPLPDQSVDMVWNSFIAHEIDEPVTFYREMRRLLKNDGRFAVIDWSRDAKEFDMGPPEDHRLQMADVETQVKEAGFTVEWTKDMGNGRAFGLLLKP